MYMPSLVKMHWQVILRKRIYGCMASRWFWKWRFLPISNPKPDLHIINAHTVWWKSIDFCSRSCPETKIWTCGGQISQLKIDENCPLAIPNQISTLSMRLPSSVKIHWYLLTLLSGNENMDVWRAGNSVENQRNSQANLHNINVHTKFGEKPLKFYSSYRPETKIRTCGGQITVINNWQNVFISNPKSDVYNIYAHTKCCENPLILVQVIARKRKYGHVAGS